MEQSNHEPPYNPEAALNRAYLTLYLLALPEEDLAQYEPSVRAAAFLPEFDPHEFNQHNSDGLNDYLECQNKTIDELSWGECYLLAQGYAPDTFSAAGRLVLIDILADILEIQMARADDKEKDAGLKVANGVIVGQILELNDIPGSRGNQKLAFVDVGVLKNEKNEPILDVDGNELREIRQIVCGGTNVLLPGHKVLVALPGARLQGGKKVRSRHLNISNEEGEVIRYDTDGVILSYEEASLTFWDHRDYFKDQVLILPHLKTLYPGRAVDNVSLILRRPDAHLKDMAVDMQLLMQLLQEKDPFPYPLEDYGKDM